MKKDARMTNRLSKEKSPYLLQHAHNPVDWYPWGEEAFAKAKKENKPIFLSIGYSTCHWCHVMERESFEDEKTAKILNEHFVPIKVDREERPDVDSVYMSYVQATSGSGGWPLSVFLTPDLTPFFGGTYFPKEPRFGQPSFTMLLGRISSTWKDKQEEIRRDGKAQFERFKAYMEGKGAGSESADLGEQTLRAALSGLGGIFDKKHGGFGRAPKFPQPPTLGLLMRLHRHFRKDGDAAGSAERMLTGTLEAMAAGGIWDHLGDGFHRYSVDRFWHVPHFEKMLYDQAQLADIYLEAFRITGNEAYAEVARGIFTYVLRDMTDEKAGGFFSAEDADSKESPNSEEKGEGLFYVWRKEEIAGLLGEKDAVVFNACHGVEANGNAPGGSDPHGEFTGRNILIRRLTDTSAAEKFSLSEADARKSLGRSRGLLFEAREKRPRPSLDDKVLTSWNGLMISAFARGHQTLGDERYLDAARRAAGFIRENLYDPESGTLRRSYREGPADIPGFADDYAFLIRGLIDLYQSDFDTDWLEWAARLQESQIRIFHDGKRGGFFDTADGSKEIILRLKDSYDGAEPSANSVSARNLLRLAALLKRDDWAKLAEGVIDAFSRDLESNALSAANLLSAFMDARDGSVQIVLAGEPSDPQTMEILRRVRRKHLPGAVVVLVCGKSRSFLEKAAPFYKTALPLEGKPTLYLCRNFSCRLPSNQPDAIAGQLDEL